MPVEVHVRKFAARYRLPESLAQERRRLDRVLASVVGDAFDHALELAGVDGREEICIRELYVPLRLRGLPGDVDLAAMWSAALAEALARAARGVSRSGLVRYATRIHALLDMAECAITGDRARVWAWQRMGLWDGPEAAGRREAVSCWIRALVREPAAIVPVLRTLAERAARGRFMAARIFTEIAGEEWRLLASSALAVSGGAADLLDGTRIPGTHEPPSRALRLAENSPLRAALAAVYGGRPVEADVRRAQAALVLLERDPAVARAPRRARALIDAIADALIAPPGDRPAAEPPRQSPATRHERARGDAETARPRGETPGAETSEETLEDGREVSRTRYGGLLYLVNLVGEMRLPDELAAAAWTRKSFRWVMHALGMVLSGAEAGDPAVLAFCGLGPDRPPPSRDEGPPDRVEAAALEALRGRVIEALLERLPGEDLSPETVLPWLCLREAEIAADPGWIDVRLSLRDVSTSIRRAGLDLDPGYVDWLGVVVRFVYG